MATLVLGAVGGLVGGPLGGALGAALGSQLDRAVLSPSRRRGPRLGDLGVQGSSYGAAIPKVFGTMRVAGTVIWATDLREDAHRSGSKAGKTTTYSYSASVAVALSARPIRGVGRIWADGKVLRGPDGAFRSETGFRLYRGEEDQPIDPLIASDKGIASTPAHRGIAYAVFDTLQLADFGNRIPSLSFEVEADEGAVPVGEVAAELSGGAIAAGGGVKLDGFAATGDTVRGALEALAAATPMPLADDGAQLRIVADPAAVPLDPALLGAAAGDARHPRIARERKAAALLPDELTIAYHEPARDYQPGLQRARRDGVGRRVARIELPAAVGADVAKGLAEAALARAWSGREALVVHLPWRARGVRAGAAVMLDGRCWRVTEWTLEAMAVRLALAPWEARPRIGVATPGEAAGGSRDGIGRTVLRLVDLPGLGDGAAEAPRVFAAAAGTEPGWRRAELALSLDDGASWAAAGRTALPATMGRTIGALPAGPRELLDLAAAVEIDLLHERMTLVGTSLDGLVAGANVALVGEELIQFGAADRIGPTRWRLSRLMRGRRGTEPAIGGHATGEDFLLVEPGALQPLDVPLRALGVTIRASAIGPGDPDAATAALAVTGRAVRPPAPVALTADRRADGAIGLRWIRRSRTGWTWLDGGDAPLGEDAELYRLDLGAPGGGTRTIETTEPDYLYTPEQQAVDGVADVLAAQVRQIGTYAASAVLRDVFHG